MSKKKKLRKKIGERLSDGEAALVVCTGKKCAPREASRALLELARAHTPEHVVVAPFGCLGVCKKGPIVATLRAGKKKVTIEKRVDEAACRAMLLELAEPR